MSPKDKPTSARPGATAARAAELRAQQERAQRQRKQMTLAGVALAALLVIGGIWLALQSRHDDTPAGGTVTSTAGATGTSAKDVITSLPASRFDTGAAAATSFNPQSLPKALPKPEALTTGGKPRITYVGAEFCPFCGAQRWALVAALSRFGTFDKLDEFVAKEQSTTVPTFNFHGDSYSSKYFAFDGLEVGDLDNQPLDPMPADLQKLYKDNKLDGGVPKVIYSGKVLQDGAMPDVQLFANKSHADIVAALQDPGSDLSKQVIGAANVITAQICKQTGNQPDNVCSSAGVMTAAQASQAG